MVKLTITNNKPKSVQTALINGLSREVKQLNAEDYNYASILSSISLFESYAKLASTHLGMNVEVKFAIDHSSKGRVNLLNTTVPRVNIKDINAAFRSNYNILVDFVNQVEAIYKNAYRYYEKMIHTFNLEVTEYNESISGWINEVNELTTALSNAGVTQEEIQEVLNEAKEESEAQVEEVTKDAEEIAKDVWDTNKGYETTSDVQSKGIEAAEKYAEEQAAKAEKSTAEEDLNRAETELSKANDNFDQATQQVDTDKKAVEEAAAWTKTCEQELNQTTAVLVGLEDIGKTVSADTKLSDIKEGVYNGENGRVTQVTQEDGKTTISTIDPSNPDRVGSGIFVSTDPNATLQDAYTRAEVETADAIGKTNKATEDLKAAEDKFGKSLQELKDATEAQQTAKAEYDQAQAKADATDGYDIPYATDDELETGWDGSNNTEDDYGEDNWGDWSDIIGEGIDDSPSEGGDDDDNEDTED